MKNRRLARCPGNIRCVAALSTFFHQSRPSPSASNCWAIPSNRFARMTLPRSARRIRSNAPHFCPSQKCFATRMCWPGSMFRQLPQATRGAPPGFYPGWEFREIGATERPGIVFDLSSEPLLLLDEPPQLDEAITAYRAQLDQAFQQAEDPLAAPPVRYILSED